MESHKNALLTPRGREPMVRAVVDDGLSYTAVTRSSLRCGRRRPPLSHGIPFDALIADKAFDSNTIIADLGAKIVIAQHPRRAVQNRYGDVQVPSFDRELLLQVQEVQTYRHARRQNQYQFCRLHLSRRRHQVAMNLNRPWPVARSPRSPARLEANILNSVERSCSHPPAVSSSRARSAASSTRSNANCGDVPPSSRR